MSRSLSLSLSIAAVPVESREPRVLRRAHDGDGGDYARCDALPRSSRVSHHVATCCEMLVAFTTCAANTARMTTLGRNQKMLFDLV
jgi:hypothetical protein